MTNLESKVKSELQAIGFAVKKNYCSNDQPNTIYEQFPFNHHGNQIRADFVLLSAKIILEVDGEYWHGKKSKLLTSRQLIVKLGDENKSRFLRKEGWKVLRISERRVHSGYLKQFLQENILQLMEL